MLDSIRKRKESGFTIVEVMIVLAIAGLIILIVFLAVPALQRNSRNTQRSNDVSALLGGVAEYQAANNGSITGLTATNLTSSAKTGYYEGTTSGGQGSVNVVAATSAGVTLSTAATDDRVIIVTSAKCNGSAAAQGPSRGVVALYQVETSSTPVAKCQAS